MIPVGRRKAPAKGEPAGRGNAPAEDDRKPPRFSRFAHVLMLTLAAELLLVGGLHAVAQWSKTRGIAVPITETDKTMIT